MRTLYFSLLLLASGATAAHANTTTMNCLLHPLGRFIAFIVFCYTVMPFFRLLKQSREKKVDALTRRRVMFNVIVIVALVAVPYLFTGSCGDPRVGD